MGRPPTCVWLEELGAAGPGLHPDEFEELVGGRTGAAGAAGADPAAAGDVLPGGIPDSGGTVGRADGEFVTNGLDAGGGVAFVGVDRPGADGVEAVPPAATARAAAASAGLLGAGLAPLLPLLPLLAWPPEPLAEDVGLAGVEAPETVGLEPSVASGARAVPAVEADDASDC